MDLTQILNQIGQYVPPNVIAAPAILIGGWIVAAIVAAITRGALRRTSVDNRLAEWIAGSPGGKGLPIERWVGTGVFYLIMLFVLVAFFQALGLTAITEPLNRFLTQLFEAAPRLLYAGALLLIAWILASVLRMVVGRMLGAANIDERLGEGAGIEKGKRMPLGQTLGEVIYWVVFLFFLPAVLGALQVQGLLRPVEGMIDRILSFLPNILGAALIFVVGWFGARIIQRIVTSLLAAVGTDRLSAQLGLAAALGKQSLSGLIGLVVYVLILIPVLISALNALALDAITRPASNMLNQIFTALPLLFGAAILLVVAYVIGRVVASLIANLLAGFGFDTILVRLGLGKATAKGQQTPSQIVGYIILVAILLFASIEAARLLGFALLAELIAQFIVFAGQVLLGLVVFAVGLFLANFAAQAVRASGVAQASLLSVATRISILVLAAAMALRQMGLANDIINLAFGLLLGAIAVAVALAFGLGGREIAARELEDWRKSMKKPK